MNQTLLVNTVKVSNIQLLSFKRKYKLTLC